METNVKYKNHFERELAMKLIFLEADRRKILNKVIISKIINILTLIVFLSIFLGFLNAFPFDKFDMVAVTYIFQGFFYLIISIVVFGNLLKSIKYLLQIKSTKDLLKNKSNLYAFTAIATAISLAGTWAIGRFYLGGEIFTIKFFSRYFIVFFLLLLLAFIGRYFGNYEKKFALNFKSEILPGILTLFNPSIKYNPTNSIMQTSFEESNLFKHMQIYSYKGSDYISGSYGSFNFELGQLDVRQTSTRRGNGKTETKIEELFKGLFYMVDLGKAFSGQTLIYPDYARQFLGAKFGEMLNSKFLSDNNNLLMLEDSEFEKEFAVYSNNQVETLKLLTPSVIEKIKSVKLKLGKDIYLSFINNKLYLAIKNDTDSLSPFIFNNISYFESIEPIYSLMGTLLDFASDIKEHTK